MQEPEDIRTEREAPVKRQAKELGLELVTPAAAAELFRKGAPTVREAARDGRIDTVFTARYPGKAIRLYSLRSCIERWNHPDPATLERMRDDGHTLFVSNADGNGGLTYNVLHTEPLVSLGTVAD